MKIPARSGIRWTPLADLDGLHAEAWNPSRYETAVRKLRAGQVAPPIHVAAYANGHVSLSDGNHRLTAAREAGLQRIKVHWVIEKPMSHQQALFRKRAEANEAEAAAKAAKAEAAAAAKAAKAAKAEAAKAARTAKAAKGHAHRKRVAVRAHERRWPGSAR